METTTLVATNTAPYSATSTDLVAANVSAQRPNSNQRKFEKKPRVWCDYCNKPRHTQETCWKLHGKPTNWNSSKSGPLGSNYTVPKVNKAKANFLSAEQVDHLLQLLKSNPTFNTPTSSLA